jgi:hypothetical protein
VNKLEDTEEAFKGCNSKKDSYYKCPKSGKHNTENKRLNKLALNDNHSFSEKEI